MRIAKIEQFFPLKRTRLVKITTDDGLIGWGETTLEGKPKSVAAAVDELAEYLVGKDPLRIEHHWQHIYRSAFFRGGAIADDRAVGHRPGAVGYRGQGATACRSTSCWAAPRATASASTRTGASAISATRGWLRPGSGSTFCASSAATRRSSPARRASGAGMSRRPSSTTSSSAPT